jgi:PhnO protein
MIRESTIADLQTIYDMICDLEKTSLSYDIFSRTFHSQLVNSNFICNVYEENGNVLGLINLRVEYQLHHAERIMEIMELYVDDSSRSKGIGHQLFTFACTNARELGCTQIEVCCNQIRTRTHVFYEREGMTKSHFKLTKKIQESGRA